MFVHYLIAWLGMMLLAIANGAVRDFTYRGWVGDFRAHQLSTVTLLLLFVGYFWALFTVWPLASAHQAWLIGSVWLVMTLAFELGASPSWGRGSWPGSNDRSVG
jgi:hypothetical protein